MVVIFSSTTLKASIVNVVLLAIFVHQANRTILKMHVVHAIAILSVQSMPIVIVKKQTLSMDMYVIDIDL
jgi:hypothetical protein